MHSVFGKFEDVVVNDDKGLCVTVQGAGTTQTHGCTCTCVTGVGNNVQTGNLTLQGLVDRGEGQTVEVGHIEFLHGTGELAFRDVKTCCRGQFLGLDLYGLHHLGIVLHVDLEHCLAGSGDGNCLITDIGDDKVALVVLQGHGEVTVEVGYRSIQDTVVLVNLLNIGTDNNIDIVRYGTGDTALCVSWKSHSDHGPQQK